MPQTARHPPNRGLIAGIVAAATRPRRTLVLPFAGCLIGLLVAGASLFHVTEKPRTSVPPGYAALVNGQPILMSDFINEIQDSTGKPFDEITTKELKEKLSDMIDGELLVQRGLALNLPETLIEVRTALSDGVNAQVAAPARTNPPTDEELRAYFDKHRSDYSTFGSMLVHDIVLQYGSYKNVDQTLEQALADAAQAVFELRSGAQLPYVMDHFGFVRSGKVRDGEEIDFAAKIHLGPKLFALAAKMTDGQISDPISMPGGVHVLIMDYRHAPVEADFNDVRSNVYSNYIASKQQTAQAENLTFLREHAQIFVSAELRDMLK